MRYTRASPPSAFGTAYGINHPTVAKGTSEVIRTHIRSHQSPNCLQSHNRVPSKVKSRDMKNSLVSMQGYLAHMRLQPPRILQQDCAKGPMVALGGDALSYARGTPVVPHRVVWEFSARNVGPKV